MSWRALAEGNGPQKKGMYPAKGWKEKAAGTVFVLALHASDSLWNISNYFKSSSGFWEPALKDMLRTVAYLSLGTGVAQMYGTQGEAVRTILSFLYGSKLLTGELQKTESLLWGVNYLHCLKE